MKRFLLFVGSNYHPEGGWDDFFDDFDTIEEAENTAFNFGFEWYHIVDSTTKKKIDEGIRY